MRHARRLALASNAMGRLNQLSLALHNYHDVYGVLPPAFIADENGKPMHSWRVLILPYVDERKLYDAYDFSEPWNGPSNAKLANRMPEIFHSHTEPPSTANTNLVVVTGPGTAFPGAESTKFQDFVDGTENTILITETSNSQIPWLAPFDLSVDEMSFRVNDWQTQGISSVAWRQPYITLADGITAYAVDSKIRPAALKALTTIAGREEITQEQLLKDGHLHRRVQVDVPDR